MIQYIAEEQAGFRQSRSTIEQILNCRILMEKHIKTIKMYITTLLILKRLLTVYGIKVYGKVCITSEYHKI